MSLEFTDGQTGSGISPGRFSFPVPRDVNGVEAGKSPEDVPKGGQQFPNIFLALSQISPCTVIPHCPIHHAPV